MKLEHYNFGKPGDIRAAIDLLNSLIADCMVSEQWIRMHVQLPEDLKGSVDINSSVLEKQVHDILAIREKVVTHWISLHYGLHKAINDRHPGHQTKVFFDVIWAMFELNRMKLLAFIESAPATIGQCTNLRKQWYNQRHYFTIRDLDPHIGKGLFNMLPEHEHDNQE